MSTMITRYGARMDEPDPMIVVEASNGWCPDRKLYMLGEDGYWHCQCCGERRTYEQLVEPMPV